MSRTPAILGVLLTAVSLTACSASKSATPLSPTVAGPIPGIEISTPKMLEPSSGTKISVEKQPVTLLVENAGSNGPRPLNYSFDIATDTGFANLVFSREGIPQGDGGRTSLRMTDTLATGHTYYWRVRAQDGANTGAYATPAAFTIFTPIVIDVPGLSAPAPNATVLTLRPTFTIANSARSGPVGGINYLIELADSDSFANKVATWSVAETSNATTTPSPADLSYGKIYYWHVRAYDPTTVGPWSNTQAFQMLAEPAPVYTPSPSPSGPAPNDAINLGTAAIHNSPADVASWPVTTTITRLNLMPSGAHVEFGKQASWPEVIPPGWSGGLQYTVWIVLNINGQWHASGCIEYWRGLYESGGPVTGYSRDWYYDPIRWGAMAGHQPAPGEQVGFLVTSGDARNNGPSSIRERSNVVVVPFPSASGQSFVF
ncbi:MAG: hypothetical protein JWL71_4386 [Acidobacteria bacterium]|nr:hypothetical protein [Acidobacteriota bacterium]